LVNDFCRTHVAKVPSRLRLSTRTLRAFRANVPQWFQV
jgi:hypothetical protein